MKKIAVISAILAGVVLWAAMPSFSELTIPLSSDPEPEAVSEPSPAAGKTPKPGDYPDQDDETFAKENRRNRVYIISSEFRIGPNTGNKENDDKRPKVQVTDFFIDKYEVTARKFRKFVNDTGRRIPGDLLAQFEQDPEFPICFVSWRDADEYCRWVGGRLPTSAEWESAARARTDTKWHFGDDESQVRKYGWVRGETDLLKEHRVGQLQPNQNGLYDMVGNKEEWVADWASPGLPEYKPLRNPKGPDSGKYRVTRGGSHLLFPHFSTSASIGERRPRDRGLGIGFRCAYDSKFSPGKLKKRKGR